MYSKFLKLPPEKQESILNAAMQEFARKGYDDASTNEIVKTAEISKGLLFHYFKNKKNLFLFLYDYCIELYLHEFFHKIDLTEKDIFIRLRQALLTKLELLNKYPDIFVFLEIAYFEKSKEVKNEIAEKMAKLTADASVKIFENIDTSKFREGIDLKRAINIIVWTFDGFTAAEYKKGKMLAANKTDYEKVFAEADVYLDILKNIFYK